MPENKLSISMSVKTLYIVLIGLLVFAKLFAIYHIPLEFPLAAPMPQIIDVDTMMMVFLIMAVTIFVKFGGNDCQKIALNFMGLVLLSVVMEWYLPNLGVAIFLLTITTAASEEILFRFAIFELLWDKLKPAMIVLISAIFYTLLHAAIYGDVLYAMLVFFVGILLGMVYLRFKQNDLEVLGVITTTWLHLLIILLGVYLSVIPV
jgi:membrane protease YdiL (CAAX protease family)